MRAAIEPFTGRLPQTLSLERGPAVDRALASRRARGMAIGDRLLIGGSSVVPSSGAFASVLVHEAAHVASGGSKALVPPRYELADPIHSVWSEADLAYDAERARREEHERNETGEGRGHTLERLAEMSDREAKTEAPGIAYRAQDRGDVELANAASARLLEAWIANASWHGSLSAIYGPADAVDVLIERADAALAGGRLTLGGNYLAIAMIELVRLANAAVLARPVRTDEGYAGALSPFQRSQESEILERVERARSLVTSHGSAVRSRGDASEMAAFEAMADFVQRTEHRAGPRIAADLGAVREEPPARRRGRGRRRRREEAPVPAPPPVFASRASEDVEESAHPELERALVLMTLEPRTSYGNVRSPRYGIAGTIQGAHRMAREMFGRRSCVIIEDSLARDEEGRRQIRYLVLALDVDITPPDRALGEGGAAIHVGNVMILAAPFRRYFILAVTAGDWLFFAPTLEDHVRGLMGNEEGVVADTLSDEERRGSVFAPIDALIAAGETQEAANRLTYIGAEGFALVDVATRAGYVATLLDALTYEQNELTVLEIFRSLPNVEAIGTILAVLQRRGLLRQLHDDLESAFPSLLMMIGSMRGSEAWSEAEVRALLGQLRIVTVIPGLEVRADLSIAITDPTAELGAALRQLVATIGGAVTGFADMLLDPAAFFQGIGKMIYFAVRLELASKGHPESITYVANALADLGRALGAGMRGLAILQEQAPAGSDFVRDVQRSIEWRILWEIVGLFVGVGEVVAFADAARSGRFASALTDLAGALNDATRATRLAGELDDVAEVTTLVDRGSDAMRLGERTSEAVDTSRAIRMADEEAEAIAAGTDARGATRVTGEEPDAARAGTRADDADAPRTRDADPSARAPDPERPADVDVPGDVLRVQGVDLASSGMHRVVVTRVGDAVEIWLCTHCGRFLDRIDEALAAIPATRETAALRARIGRLRTRVANAEVRLARGGLARSDLPRELNQIGAHLRDLSRRHPDITALAIFEELPISRWVRNAESPVDGSMIRGAPPFGPGGRPGHFSRFTRDRVAEVLNNPSRVFTGVNENGRLVDVYFQAEDVVITVRGSKRNVITAYGRSNLPSRGGPSPVDPRRWADPSGWKDGELFVEYRLGTGELIQLDPTQPTPLDWPHRGR